MEGMEAEQMRRKSNRFPTCAPNVPRLLPPIILCMTVSIFTVASINTLCLSIIVFSSAPESHDSMSRIEA